MKDDRFKLINTLKVNNTLGENVLWNSADGAIWWTDIEAGELFRHVLTTGELQRWALPERAGSFGFSEKNGWLIVAFASGFAHYQPDSQQIEWLAKPEADVAGNRFNDGRVDRQGRFWAGTMVENPALSTRLGALYRLDLNGACEPQATGIRIANGLCWSPDSRFMYHADSPRHAIDIYDFDPRSGTIDNRRLFAKTAPGCRPDGATVDSEGYIYSAQWGGSQIIRYAPDGTIAGVITLPVSQPTCVAFGGENLDLLLVTTAGGYLSAEALALQPDAGNLLVYETPFRGIEEARCKIS